MKLQKRWQLGAKVTSRQNYYRNQMRWWGMDLFAIFFLRKKTVYNLVIIDWYQSLYKVREERSIKDDFMFMTCATESVTMSFTEMGNTGKSPGMGGRVRVMDWVWASLSWKCFEISKCRCQVNNWIHGFFVQRRGLG